MIPESYKLFLEILSLISEKYQSNFSKAKNSLQKFLTNFCSSASKTYRYMILWKEKMSFSHLKRKNVFLVLKNAENL